MSPFPYPRIFSCYGVACEMGCGSKTSRKVSTEFLNVPGTEAGWIPDLQSFQGPAEERPADLVGIHIKRKEKSLFKHHAAYTARQMNAAFHTSPSFSALTLLMSHLKTGERSPELLLWSDHRHSEGVHPWKSLFFLLSCSLFVVDQGPSNLS